jgi:hypothetical protein
MGKIYIEDVVRLARAELGYREKASNSQLDDKAANAGSGNFTKYGRDLAAAGFFNGSKNGFDWCTQYVPWLGYQASGRDAAHTKEVYCHSGPYAASCTWSVRYYKEAGRWSDTPHAGDQVFFGTYEDVRHTGLVLAVDGDTFYTSEGNSADMVRERTYKVNDPNLVGFGRPRYDGDKAPEEDQEPASEAERPEAGEYSSPELEAAVRAVQEADRAACMNNDAGDWSREAREWAVRLGIVRGVGKGEDGEPVYAWQLPLTLERLVTVLHRLFGGQ